jgi:N-carbamoylputrescine amidase
VTSHDPAQSDLAQSDMTDTAAARHRRLVTVACVQMSMSEDRTHNLHAAESFIRSAAAQGAEVIVLPELFEGRYFCIEHNTAHFDLACRVEESPAVTRCVALARELNVVLAVSIFERDQNNLFNTVVMIDAGGEILGRYRKSHIPDGPGYSEKFYFTPGDTGFKVWTTRWGRIGVGICWDQWFPEAARAMALAGAELLLYPTAIGSEPEDPSWDSSAHWQRSMQGHAAANIIPVIAANRHGLEQADRLNVTFYGSSFMTDSTGEICALASRDQDQILITTYDLAAIESQRLRWGVFRDRRPDLYGPLTSHGSG